MPDCYKARGGKAGRNQELGVESLEGVEVRRKICDAGRDTSYLGRLDTLDLARKFPHCSCSTMIGMYFSINASHA